MKNAPARDNENPDPHELNRPIPKILLTLVALLLAWAVYYIATHASDRESSIPPKAQRSSAAAARAS